MEDIKNMTEAQLFDSIMDVKQFDGVQVNLTNVLSWREFQNETHHFVLEGFKFLLFCHRYTREPRGAAVVNMTLDKSRT